MITGTEINRAWLKWEQDLKNGTNRMMAQIERRHRKFRRKFGLLIMSEFGPVCSLAERQETPE